MVIEEWSDAVFCDRRGRSPRENSPKTSWTQLPEAGHTNRVATYPTRQERSWLRNPYAASGRILYIRNLLQLVFLPLLHFLLSVLPCSFLSLRGFFYCLILSGYHLFCSSCFQLLPNHNASFLTTTLPPVRLYVRLML